MAPIRPGSDSAKASDCFARTRRSIIDRLPDWADRHAWERFHRTYWRVIYSFALQSGLTPDEASDVVQETMLSVAKQFQQKRFNAEAGTFKSWLRNLARWRIADRLRKRDRHIVPAGQHRPDESLRTPTIERVPAEDEANEKWEQEWKEAVFKAACERVRRSVPPRQYQIFDCYVIQGWEMSKVTRELNVSPALVHVTKHRIRDRLKKEIQQLENGSPL